jgi:hypothetical protein
MRSRACFGLVFLTGLDLALVAAVCLAQQPRPSAATPVRRGYYSRVQTQASAGARSRADVSRDTSRGLADPIRPYGEETRTAAGLGNAPRPYERVPVVSPPQRSVPAPASHNYYPGLRTGQGLNRNTAPVRCVPGRQSLLHR